MVMNSKEPYRATKLWNEVILAFQSGMPVKKHTRRFQTYNNCFMASDAVTWLHCFLMNNSNFGSGVTRQQAVNLLKKFVKCHVIESVTLKKMEFRDNSHLYRFTPISPQQLGNLPLRLVQSPSENNKLFSEHSKGSLRSKTSSLRIQKENISHCVFIEKKISLTELGLMWKTATLSRLETMLPNLSLSDILDEKSVDGHNVRHNVSRISRTGVVALIDKTDDIPHWIISAMKCLANWPNASGSGSCLPNYPGFEKDVFKVVRDYFLNPQDPLIPAHLSSLMLNIFVHLIQPQLNEKQFMDVPRDHDTSKHCLDTDPVQTSTPLVNNEIDLPSVKNSIVCQSNDGKLLLDDPEVMWDYPSAVYFETDFATSDPVTKMLPQKSKISLTSPTNSFFHCNGSIESLSTISVCSMSQELSINQPNALNKYWNSDPCLQVEARSNSSQIHGTNEYNIRQSHSMFDYLHVSPQEFPMKTVDPQVDVLNASICSTKTLTEDNVNISFNQSRSYEEATPVLLKNNFLSTITERSKSTNAFSFESGNLPLKKVKELVFPPELKSCLQLVLLFLDPPNRRQIHLLFRVINKIIKNGKFLLDVQNPMCNYLIETFLPAVIQAEFKYELMFEMISFILDNLEKIFQPPEDLKEEVENLIQSRSGKIVYSLDDAYNLTYCEMVSKQQYEEQKITVSMESLRRLLTTIIQDKTLTEKEKKKKLKQFKENHPEVYYKEFPRKERQMKKSKSAFLSRLAELRM